MQEVNSWTGKMEQFFALLTHLYCILPLLIAFVKTPCYFKSGKMSLRWYHSLT